MTPSVVIFNGPPNSGKDTVVDHFCQFDGFEKHQFKDKLFELTCAAFCISREEFNKLYTRELKEEKTHKLRGFSPREALIHVSEVVMKPNFGDDYFGKAAADELSADNVNVFSDGGFIKEIEPVVDKVGQENVLFFRIHRKGCDFSKDSRSYIYPEGVYKNMTVIDVGNNGTVNEFLERTVTLFNQYVVNSSYFKGEK